MAHDSRHTKRRRTSGDPRPPLLIVAPGEPSDPSTSKDSQEIFTHHPHFWLNDGNLILIAGATAFRVFRSILVNKSAVFADMFATGSVDATEMFDGCPVVRLPDHPEDLRDFLQYLIPCLPLRLSTYNKSPVVDFSAVHAAIHLAHKYQCPDVEARALSVLKNYYTSHFAECDWHGAALSRSTLSPPPPALAAIAAVNIARLTETPSMLPYAFYLLCDLGAPMVKGYMRRDGSVEHLSTRDLQLCIAARNKLAWELVDRIERVFPPGTQRAPSQTCSSSRCLVARDMARDAARSSSRGECSALGLQNASIEKKEAGYQVCSGCKKEMLWRDVEERRRIWMLLPEMFGLGVDECAFTDGRDEESTSDSYSDDELELP